MKKRILAFMAACLLFAAFVGPDAAGQASIPPEYEDNNITWYSPIAGAVNCGGSSLSVSGSNNVEIVLKVLMGAGMNLAQAAGVAGNLVVESGDENINPAAEEFPGQDRGGKGVVQWTADRWRGNDGLRAFAEYKGTPWQNMNTQMEFILWEVGKGSPWNGKPGGAERSGWEATLKETTAAAAAETWMLRYERPGVPHLDRRISHANRIYQEYNGQSINPAALSLSNPVNCANSPIEGDIVTTAKNLAWPHRVQLARSTAPKYGRDASKPEYVEAVENMISSFYMAEFTDCGIFVATVMRSSGVDPEYPTRGTGLQLPYVQNSPKYRTFVATSESELQPGDILIRPGHTYMYVGPYTAPEDGREYKAVGASWFTRPPSGHSLYLSGNSNSDISSSSPFTIARFIGGANDPRL